VKAQRGAWIITLALLTVVRGQHQASKPRSLGDMASKLLKRQENYGKIM